MPSAKVLSKKSFFRAIGRRKTATAQVHLKPGTGLITINNTVIDNPNPLIRKPLTLCGEDKKIDVSIKLQSGGKSAHIDAIRLGIARALIQYNPSHRQTLKKAGLLTRDPRAKERKKPGLKRARRAPQWQKR